MLIYAIIARHKRMESISQSVDYIA